MTRNIGCYVHIPFCVRKCAYCDFNSYSGYGVESVRRYVEAIKREIRVAPRPATGEVVDTIFFGGGTPTAIPAEDEAAILREVIDRLDVSPGAEITTEANPGASDVAGLSILREAGFNRISFGVQSFDDELLVAIDRIHSADEAETAVLAARSAGFENISIDLMFGLPRQTARQWTETLDRAFELQTDHLSMYALIVEDGTGFGRMMRRGTLVLPADDLAADMYLEAIERAESEHYEQYEISNFARKDCRCRHNLHYWRADDYYGFGAGAVAGRSGVRRTNVLRPAEFVRAIMSGATLYEGEESLTEAEQRGECMMLGLRMTAEGVDVRRFADRFGYPPQHWWPAEIARHTALGLLEADDQDQRLRLSKRGVFLANEVMLSFV